MTIAFFAPNLWLRRLFLTALKRLRIGELTLITPEKETWHFVGKEKGLTADITIHDWAMIKNLFLKGDIGFAEDYIEGLWESQNLPALLTLAVKNEEALEHLFHGNWLMKLWFRFRHWQNANTKKGSKRNIRAHYDVGNDFYQLWLDPSMTYSSALYTSENDTLVQAQTAKYARILDAIPTAKNILEIGCGWGGFMEEAAKRGMRVKGLTLSREQAAFATERLKEKGDVVIQDYRDETVQYDAIVSIEMFEAVGERYWPVYFTSVKKALKKGGKAVIQTITIADDIFEEYLKRSDFLQQYTFPGGALPSPKRFIAEAEDAGLKIISTHAFGQDYAKTLTAWLSNMESQLAVIRELDYSEEFIRSWRFYLAYCICGFATGRTDVMQVELEHA